MNSRTRMVQVQPGSWCDSYSNNVFIDETREGKFAVSERLPGNYLYTWSVYPTYAEAEKLALRLLDTFK